MNSLSLLDDDDLEPEDLKKMYQVPSNLTYQAEGVDVKLVPFTRRSDSKDETIGCKQLQMIFDELEADRSRTIFIDSTHTDTFKACYESKNDIWDAEDKLLIKDLVRMNQLRVGSQVNNTVFG